MKKLLLLLLLLSGNSSYAQVKERITVTVHPGIELFTIIQILADKYPEPALTAYSREVIAWFGKYKSHPAVKKAASFGKTYTDMPELGWCMSGFPVIQLYEPAELGWYKMYGKENVLEYMRLCRDFFNDTHFWDFFQQHTSRYATWGKVLKAGVDSARLVEKLQDFYGYEENVHWYICIDPLNSWGSHAVETKVLNPQYADWVVYNTSSTNNKADSTQEPHFSFTNFDYLVFHEGSHIFLKRLLKQYESQIDSLSYLFNKDDEGMKRNNISNWQYCFDENMVRSITAALYKKYRDDRSFRKQMAKELLNDFIYVEELEPFIYDNYVSSGRYKNFAAFFPEVLQFLKQRNP